MPKIESISCHKVLNSRGDWTISTKVTLDDGSIGEQTIPDGASKGENEAIYIPVERAVDIVSVVINDALQGLDPFDQVGVDTLLLEMDGTPNKKHLGGNSILSVSLAVAKACAHVEKVELFQYLSKIFNNKLITAQTLSMPTPVFNVINGGKHADNDLSFQEFMVIPARSSSYDKALQLGVDVYDDLEKILEEMDYGTDVGDEGGFAPRGFTVYRALELIKKASNKKYKSGEDVFFGMDIAAESFYSMASGAYSIKEENRDLSSDQLQDYYLKLLKDFEIIYLEDPFYEKDTQAWQKFNADMKSKLLVVGDDLVVTNKKYLDKALDSKLINGAIVKPNQVGTLTETFDFIRLAKENGISICVSHRSGDNADDTFIADLAVAVSADFIKSGAPARGERVAKYNRLLEIFNLFNNVS